jgi:cysteinyl-tRNA synthetase
MAMKYLGPTLDIHAGGIDLTFPHHENEIAQSESITGQPFARFWLHSEHLLVEWQKMSKSLGNFFTLRDLEAKGYKPEAVRYLLASVPYRKKLNFTFDALDGANTAIDRLRNFNDRLNRGHFPPGFNIEIGEAASGALKKFEESLDDDLNTAEALGAVFEFVREMNTAMDEDRFPEGNKDGARGVMAAFDRIFDVLTPSAPLGGLIDEEIEKKIAERNQAKKARDFARADGIRAWLLEQGVVIEDTRDGVRWKRK